MKPVKLGAPIEFRPINEIEPCEDLLGTRLYNKDKIYEEGHEGEEDYVLFNPGWYEVVEAVPATDPVTYVWKRVQEGGGTGVRQLESYEAPTGDHELVFYVGPEDLVNHMTTDTLYVSVPFGTGYKWNKLSQLGAYTVRVYTDSTLEGTKITLTKTGYSYQSTVSGQVASFNVPEGGIWRATSTTGKWADTEAMLAYGIYDVSLNGYHLYGFGVQHATTGPATFDYDIQYQKPDGSWINVDNYSYTAASGNNSTHALNYGSWSTDEFFMPRPCLVKRDCTEKIYLNPYDLKQDVDGNNVESKINGTEGEWNAFAEFGKNGKKIWVKVQPLSSYAKTGGTEVSEQAQARIYICDEQLDSDFHAYPFYDYDGILRDHFYYGLFPGTLKDGRIRSIISSGRSTVSSFRQCIIDCMDNDTTSSKEYFCTQYGDFQLIKYIMMLMFKKWDIERAFSVGMNYTDNYAPTSSFTPPLPGSRCNNGPNYCNNSVGTYNKFLNIEGVYGAGLEMLVGYTENPNNSASTNKTLVRCTRSGTPEGLSGKDYFKDYTASTESDNINGFTSCDRSSGTEYTKTVGMIYNIYHFKKGFDAVFSNAGPTTSITVGVTDREKLYSISTNRYNMGGIGGSISDSTFTNNMNGLFAMEMIHWFSEGLGSSSFARLSLHPCRDL